MAVMAEHGVAAVNEVGNLMEEMLETAHEIKQTHTVDPPLHKSDLGDLQDRIAAVFSPSSSDDFKKHSIETAVRNLFYKLLATTAIESPSFVNVWNLLDVVSILCDENVADPALMFWLVEELVDSQTISGCRKVFDFLESRRERIIAKFWKAKYLVILRTCNELLRRLSRAEDTAFCGRVFIFLFQSFPLGDKSSVNLRGEYHTGNVTTFEPLPPRPKEPSPATMEVDVEDRSKPESDAEAAKMDSQESTSGNKGVTVSKDKSKPEPDAKSAKDDKKKPKEPKYITFDDEEKPMDTDELYPIFWGLQQHFSQPRSVFDPEVFASFKSGLRATMVKFEAVQNAHLQELEDQKKEKNEDSGRPSKLAEQIKETTKRKRQENDELATAFHGKYLTSPDLFELETRDLSFRRHILVQILVMLDFLLSQTDTAKAKVTKEVFGFDPNKSVTYDWTLNAEDTNWVRDTKMDVVKHMKQGSEGPFYYRMIESILSRDKNWVRWKIENCPPISRDPTSPEDQAKVKRDLDRFVKKRKLNSGLADKTLDFLKDGNNIHRLKDSSRYEVRPLHQYDAPIEVDSYKIEHEEYNGGESNQTLTEAKASKIWRALRTAAATKLVAFDKIDRSDKIDEIFKNPKSEEPITQTDDDPEPMDIDMPADRRPVILSGPSGVGKGTLVTMLMEKHPKVFGKKASHTTRPPREGEVHGKHYYFVNKQEYDILRDGDKFLEFNKFNGNDYGTSRKVVEDIEAQGKVPLMEMDYHGIQQLKDQEYPSRFIFLDPPDIPTLEKRLKERGTDDEEKIKQRLEIALEEIKQSKVEGFHDKIIVNDNLDTAYKELEDYIFGREGGSAAGNLIVGEEKVEAEPDENGHSTPAVAETVVAAEVEMGE